MAAVAGVVSFLGGIASLLTHPSNMDLAPGGTLDHVLLDDDNTLASFPLSRASSLEPGII